MSGVRGAPPAVTAVVMGARAGARLARALDSVAWAAERVVLDPAGSLAETALPADVRRLTAPEAVVETGGAPWLLLLREDETVPAALAAEVAAVARAGPPRAYRIGQELRGAQGRLRLRGASVRLAPRAGARLVFERGLALALSAPAPRARLEEPLARELGDLDAALEQIDAVTTALAHLLALLGASCRARRMLAAAAATGARVLGGSARVRLGWGRWILAVLAAYEPVVTYAKLWELHRCRPVLP